MTDFSLDMSKAFIKGITEEFEGAHLTFDKFGCSSRFRREIRREVADLNV